MPTYERPSSAAHCPRLVVRTAVRGGRGVRVASVARVDAPAPLPVEERDHNEQTVEEHEHQQRPELHDRQARVRVAAVRFRPVERRLAAHEVAGRLRRANGRRGGVGPARPVRLPCRSSAAAGSGGSSVDRADGPRLCGPVVTGRRGLSAGLPAADVREQQRRRAAGGGGVVVELQFGLQVEEEPEGRVQEQTEARGAPNERAHTRLREPALRPLVARHRQVALDRDAYGEPYLQVRTGRHTLECSVHIRFNADTLANS